MKNKLLPLIFVLASYSAYSQVGIGTPMPNASSQLEVVANDKGMLIPRIKLTSTTDKSTITNGNINSLLIFNTMAVADVKPGYYYWYDSKWNRIVVSGEINTNTGNVIYNPTNQQFTYVDGTGVTQIITLDGLKGEKGDSFKYSDFTQTELDGLKGADGKSFTFSDFTQEQLDGLKGADGKSFTFSDFTQEQLDGLKGADGKSF
ncbi:hypothetical protein LPB87_14335, partial [Flavobacterium sp. EDS]|nr:hypothetical protein [Flavobacterium sp. EDS]